MWRRLVTSLFQDTALLKRLLQVKKWCVSWLQEDLGEEKIAKKCFTWAASAIGAGLSKQAQLTPEWMHLRNPSGNPAGMALEGITMDCCDHHLGFEANLWFTMGKCWLFHVIEVRILQSSFWMHGTDTNRDCVCVSSAGLGCYLSPEQGKCCFLEQLQLWYCCADARIFRSPGKTVGCYGCWILFKNQLKVVLEGGRNKGMAQRGAAKHLIWWCGW